MCALVCYFLSSVNILMMLCCLQSVIQALIFVSLYVQWHYRLWVGSTQCSAPLLQPS